MKSKVSLIKGSNRYSNIKKALEFLGPEIKKKIKSKKRILVKPNLVTAKPEKKAAVTHVDALAALLDFIIPLKSKKAKIIIGEDCASDDTIKAFNNFGYRALQKKYKIKLKDLSKDRVVPVKIYSKTLKKDLKQHIFKTFLDSDFIISVGPPKTHDSVIVTLSLKNIVIGALAEKYKTGKENFHQGPKALNLSIARLGQVIHPHLSVIDGFKSMQGNGPTNGEIVNMNLALVSLDFLAADGLMTRIMGFDPEDVGYLHYCKKLKLGSLDLSDFKIVGNAKWQDNVRKFKPHLTYFLQKRWKLS